MWRRVQSVVMVVGGILPTLLGLVIVLKLADDPNKVGPGVGMAFMTTLYGLILAYGVIQPLIAGFQRKLEDLEA